MLLFVLLLLVGLVAGTALFLSMPALHDTLPAIHGHPVTQKFLLLLQSQGISFEFYGPVIIIVAALLLLVLFIRLRRKVHVAKSVLEESRARRIDAESRVEELEKELEELKDAPMPDTDDVSERLDYLKEESKKLSDHLRSLIDDSGTDDEIDSWQAQLDLLQTNLASLDIALQAVRAKRPANVPTDRLESLLATTRSIMDRVKPDDADADDDLDEFEEEHRRYVDTVDKANARQERLARVTAGVEKLNAELSTHIGASGIVEQLRSTQRAMEQLKTRLGYLRSSDGRDAGEVIERLVSDLTELENDFDQSFPPAAAETLQGLERRLETLRARLHIDDPKIRQIA